MLDFICMEPVELSGPWKKRKLQNDEIFVHSGIHSIISASAFYICQVGIADPLFIERISVYETFNGGGVRLVQVMSPEQKWITVLMADSARPGIHTKSNILNIFPKVG